MSQSYRVPKTFSSLRVTGQFAPSAIATALSTVTASSYALSAVDSGKVTLLQSTSGIALTLPPVARSAGLSLRLLVSAAGTAANTITKATSDSACILGMVGSVSSAGVAKSSISAGTGGSASDYFDLVSNGTNWFLRGSSANAVTLA
jgi:hypothetical protein